ncbi:hypothetical protein ACM61V_03215 [Sphingomonas sp. TX0543]|uniref:hypothetical protein n=1 Tax=unclassified Sphingomonas TaxID=196159 RepID=UPI0010F43F22|nr:hypothetical protein [Sphingomonas sp. 3P27F8]
MKRAIALMILVALGACKAPVAEQRSAAPDPGIANDAATASGALPTQAPSPIPDKRIPVSFQGRWGLVPADCTTTNGDEKGLMTVTADRLSFYESRATITKLVAVSPTVLDATLAFSGEGQTWEEKTPLTLSENGTVLSRVADGQTLRYTRCAA